MIKIKILNEIMMLSKCGYDACDIADMLPSIFSLRVPLAEREAYKAEFIKSDNWKELEDKLTELIAYVIAYNPPQEIIDLFEEKINVRTEPQLDSLFIRPHKKCM